MSILEFVLAFILAVIVYPSYVFFESHPTGARTALGVQATPGRTIAVGPDGFIRKEH